jgi:glycosyltransferase involved in cell wall biosynthesis
MINLMTPINNLGYGVAGLNILKALQKQIDVALHIIGQPDVSCDEDIAAVKKGLEKAKLFDHRAPCVKIWHQNQMAERIGSGKFIGFPIFELNSFNNVEKNHLNSCDELMVCSKWAKSIAMDQCYYPVPPEVLDNRIHVVPLGVDTEIFKPQVSKRDKTIFFNCGKWEKRKGHDVLLECFNRAFRYEDNVELWMMCYNPFIGQQNQGWEKLYKNSPLGSKIRMIPRQKTHQDVYNIMKQTDCGVFPARAEGWNLELLEMMACGKDVIATNYSAHTEFCNKENSFLIDIHSLEPAYDGVFFTDDHGEWASFNDSAKSQLIEHMRNVHGVKQQYLNGHDKHLYDFCSPNRAGIETANKFTWENSAQELLNGL